MTIVIGDSIAVGLGAALHAETHAREGAGSCEIARNYAQFGAGDTVVISAGVNDAPGPCLGDIRRRVRARRIIWILPAPVNSARAHVAAEARAYGDETIGYLPGRGGLHPASYAALARRVR